MICRNCGYWQWDHMGPEYQPTDVYMAGSQRGQCRRRAPVIGPTKYGDVMTTREWPFTCGDDWCGEFTDVRLFRGNAEKVGLQTADPPVHTGRTDD